MPKDTLRRYLPTPARIREYRVLRPVRHWLQNPEIWHLHRRSVSGATFIGLFCAFMPVPSQMLLAAVLAVASRCNLPLAVAWVWITNPLTIPPIFYFSYRLGAWLLDRDHRTELELAVGQSRRDRLPHADRQPGVRLGSRPDRHGRGADSLALPRHPPLARPPGSACPPPRRQ